MRRNSHFRHRLAGFLAIPLAILGLQAAAQANLIADGGFELPSIAPATFQELGSGAAIGPWTVTGTVCGGNCLLVLATNYTEFWNGHTLQFQSQEGHRASI